VVSYRPFLYLGTRLNEPTPSQPLRFASFEINTELGELRHHGYKIRLQEKPFQILVALLERPGSLVTRDELHQRLWRDNTFVDFDHNLNNAVNKLREALNDSSEKPRFIETIPRRGYRFVAELELASKGNGIRDSAQPAVIQSTNHAQTSATGPEKVTAPSSIPAPQLESHASEKSKSPRLIWRPSANRIWLTAAAASAAFIAIMLPVIRPKPVLSNTDLVLISDSVNTTGDAVFDDTLKQAISVALMQSPYFNVLAEARISAILELMMKPADTKLTPSVARDLCQRSGTKAYVVTSITKLGTQYVIGLNAINCQTGDSLAKEQATAPSKEQVLKALDQAATKFRKRLGESLSSVQKYDSPLELATTSSLEALKSYSLANSTRSDAEAIPLFKRAVDLDPDFALAYDGLGISYSNINEPGFAAENVTKAYQLRERASEREKLRIAADYFQVVTGELEKANQTCELWAQIYPRDHYPHNLLGVNYEFLGKYEKAVAETLEAIRLNPDSSFLYSNLMEDYAALGRIDEAKATYQQALALKRDQVFLHADRYGIAFLQGDQAEMARQVSWSNGRPGAEDWLLSNESDTYAFRGHIEMAREFSQRAVASALHNDEKEAAALWQINAALQEAEVGNLARARQEALAALKLASTRDVRILAALTLSRSGEISGAEKMADDLARQFPVNTVIQSYWLPTIRASIELHRGHGEKAIEDLERTRDYEWGGPNPEIEAGRFLYPIYMRGHAYLLLHKGNAAASEFRKILDHPGIVQNCPLGALAHLGLARASIMLGDTAGARVSYDDFFTLWKDADISLPVLRKAKSEYASIQ
jgi:DNA-binding winged helix-turn-helix (wHTH) protein/tetratricopeptide (TPR) repeat protein